MDRCSALCLLIGAVMVTVTAATDTASTVAPLMCTNGTYKLEGDTTTCSGICGYCLDQGLVNATDCDQETGKCPKHELQDGSDGAGCLTGWRGEYCSDPLCDEGFCGSGKCIAPNVCFCGYDINIVGTNCEDIRVRGVVGSIAAFATVTASIALCGLGSKLYKRRKEGASL